jgi:hypothetical protein
MPDEPGEITSFRIVSWDTIDLPTDRIKDKLPVHRTVRDHPSLPNRSFDLYFDYNENAQFWTWKVELDEVGEIIPRQPVHYAEPYAYDDYVVFNFVDFSREDREVTHRTLGDEVELVATPGPDSPGWDDWIARQEILERQLPQVGAL